MTNKSGLADAPGEAAELAHPRREHHRKSDDMRLERQALADRGLGVLFGIERNDIYIVTAGFEGKGDIA